MSEVYGFCITARQDEPLAGDGICVEHGTVAIPPSWGSKSWRWDRASGTWQPYKDRPPGYVWVQPVDEVKPSAARQTALHLRPTKAPPTIAYTPPKAITCQYCGKVRKTTARTGGTPQKYCSRTCKVRAGYLREKKKAPPPTPPPAMLTCRACRQPFPKPKTGGRQLDCSPACHRVSTSRMRAKTMAEAGIDCVCGHPDRPHKGLGMCNPCCLRARREAKRADACRGCARTGLWITARGMCETCYRRVRQEAS